MTGWATQLPDPDHLWIRHRPRRWPAAPGADVLWLDLARGVLGAPGEGPADPARAPLLPRLPDPPPDDVVYVPPVDPAARAERDREVARLAAAGTPLLVQLLPGEPSPTGGATAVYDLLGPLAAGDLDRLGALPAGTAAVWPLVAGLTDDPELWRAGCRALAAAGVATAQPVRPALPAADRRRLAAGRDEETFAALFHRPAPDERAFARVAHRAGLAPFLPRPVVAGAAADRTPREPAGLLALAGELTLRLGRGTGRGQSLYRAARLLDRTACDVRALVREGNLSVLPWLDDTGRQVLEEWARAGRSAAVDDLLATYLDDRGGSEAERRGEAP